jgi:hypothetical protein
VVIIFLENGKKKGKSALLFGLSKSPKFQKFQKKSPDFLYYVPFESKQFYFHFLVRSSICFNCLMSGCHFSYIADIETQRGKN